ncbi:hypothetical protein ZWY2020_042106 [Hordeum vulgare]|nr:hypothetical protein ZWY2020_042106 [Hordeum vulgare]
MPKHTMGGIGHEEVDARAAEASKPSTKLHMKKHISAGEGLSGQQGCLDVLVVVHGLHPHKVGPPPDQVTPQPRQLPPLTQTMVDAYDDDDGEAVTHLTSIFCEIKSSLWLVFFSFSGEGKGFCFSLIEEILA